MDAVKVRNIKLNIGSNILEGFDKIFDIDNNDILKISYDDILKISLIIPHDKGWVKIVDENISNSPHIKIITDLKNHRVEIKFNDNIIVKVEKKEENLIEVNKLDLRKLGLNIFIDNNSLRLGNATFSGNTFKNVNTVFKLG